MMLHPALRRALRSRIRLLSLTLLATLAACGGGGGGSDDDRTESRRTLTVGTTSLMAGQTTRGTLREPDGTIVDPASVQWTSSDATIAAVSASGFVSTVGAGSVTITADGAGELTTAELTVSPPPTDIPYIAVELSPPVFSEADGGDVAIIVDAPTRTATVTVQSYVELPEPPVVPISLQRLGDSRRFVAVVPEADVRAALQRNRSSIRCEIAGTCAHDPVADDDIFLGFLRVADASEYVLADEIGLQLPLVPAGEASVQVTALEPNVQRSAYVVNIARDDVRANGTTPSITKTFYRHFDDAYDYLVLFETAASWTSPYFEPLRNRVSGIGQPIYDESADYGGSANGRVLGIVNYGVTHFDLSHVVLAHEMGHAFMNFLPETALATNTAHWPLSTAAFGVMGTTSPNIAEKLTALPDGTYRVEPQIPFGGMNDLELYFFGLADPSEVEDQIVFDTQPIDIGSILQGPYARVTIDDLIATYGPREPAWNGSPVTFRLATIVVSRGRLLTPLEMTYFERSARHGEDTERRNPYHHVPFNVATRGRGVLVTKLD